MKKFYIIKQTPKHKKLNNSQFSILNSQLIKSFSIFIVLLPVFLLQGCWLANMPVYVPPHVPAQPVIEDPPTQIDLPQQQETAPAQGRFTLRYEPASTLNPLLTYNRDNISITSLIYESLFVLNENLRPQSLLCESWDTIDFVTYTFTIYPDIAMHDGSTLTAGDVAYSIRQASQRGRHRNKLRGISSVSVSPDDELTVTVTLNEPNVRFVRLLDIPIIKADSMDSDLPPGTGPYIFPNPENLILTRFAGYRDYAELPLPTIYLRACNDSDLTELFDQSELTLLWDDPSGAFEIRINRDHEPRYYNTTSLQFLGFNADNFVLRNADVRRAIGCAVNRQYITENIMNDPRPGQTIAAPVAISPIFDLYDSAWEQQVFDPMVEMAALLERAGIEDYNNDGFLEIYEGAGRDGMPFKLQILVNVENSKKVEAAEHIATSLRQVGFDIEVKVLAWNDFLAALNDGDFDIYYGEVQLGADFDLSPLLLPGDGSLNYGKTANTAYETAINNFLAAQTYEEVSATGLQLCDEIRRNAPFIPILYKRYAIYSPIGVISNSSPSQSGIFYNFKSWRIDLDMLT